MENPILGNRPCRGIIRRCRRPVFLHLCCRSDDRRQRAAGAVATAKPAAATQTAGQKYKNIQVLKDIPADQLIPSMQFITYALGVECDFCHVDTPAEFDKDDKKPKKTARKMMRDDVRHQQEQLRGRARGHLQHMSSRLAASAGDSRDHGGGAKPEAMAAMHEAEQPMDPPKTSPGEPVSRQIHSGSRRRGCARQGDQPRGKGRGADGPGTCHPHRHLHRAARPAGLGDAHASGRKRDGVQRGGRLAHLSRAPTTGDVSIRCRSRQARCRRVLSLTLGRVLRRTETRRASGEGRRA